VRDSRSFVTLQAKLDLKKQPEMAGGREEQQLQGVKRTGEDGNIPRPAKLLQGAFSTEDSVSRDTSN
jgi:hypothetical protein